MAALIVAALMVKSGWQLIRDSWRIFLEAAPRGMNVAAIDSDLHNVPGVLDVHDLHLWEVTTGYRPCPRTSWSIAVTTVMSDAKPSLHYSRSGIKLIMRLSKSTTPPQRSCQPKA